MSNRSWIWIKTTATCTRDKGKKRNALKCSSFRTVYRLLQASLLRHRAAILMGAVKYRTRGLKKVYVERWGGNVYDTHYSDCQINAVDRDTSCWWPLFGC